MSNKKRLIIYSAITIFCGIFSVIYEHFSHDVYSVFMVYLFAIPLLLGVVPELVSLFSKSTKSSPWSRLFRHFAVATLTVGSTLQGVLEIYGTTNGFVIWYLVAGICLFVISFVIWLAANADDKVTAPQYDQ